MEEAIDMETGLSEKLLDKTKVGHIVPFRNIVSIKHNATVGDALKVGTCSVGRCLLALTERFSPLLQILSDNRILSCPVVDLEKRQASSALRSTSFLP